MIRKPKEKLQSILLRQKGYSLKEISNELHISKSTASLWLKNVKISPEAQKRLEKTERSGTLRGLGTIQVRWQSIQKEIEQETKKITREVLTSISLDKNYFKLLAALIFWCEGGKRSKSAVRFINSDPELVKTFLRLLRKGFVINEGKLRATLHLHGYHNEVAQRRFWSKVTGIPSKRFSKSYIKPHTGNRLRDNYPGCISIAYTDGGKTIAVFRSLYASFPQHLYNIQ